MEMTDSDVLRFEEKILKLPGENECWVWTAGINKDGYGQFKLNGTMVRAHRIAYELYKGTIPVGLEVMHECDRPFCVSPHHLKVGTHQENMDDRESKGRGHDKRGECNGRSKLTLQEVWQIRDLVKCKLFTQIEIGEMYNISNVVVSKIHLRQLWKSGENPYESAAH